MRDVKLSIILSPFAVGVASRVIVQFVAFVQIVIASRFLGLGDFGTYTLGWASCVIVVSFVYTGIYQALLRNPDFNTSRHTGFWSMATIGIAGALVLAAVGLALIPGQPQIGAVFLGFVPLPLIRTLVAWNEVHLVRDRRVRMISIYGLLAEMAALAVTWLALTQGHGLFALVYGRYTALAVEATMAVGAARSLPSLRFSRQAFRTLRTTAVPLWGTSALGMFSNYGADLILGAFLNTAAVGTFRSAARISMTAADVVYQPLGTLTWSRMSQLDKAGRHAEFKSVWLDHMGFGAIMLWPVLLAIAVLAPDLVLFLFDESWLPAAPVIAILCVSRGFNFLTTLLEPTMACLGRGRVQVLVRGTSVAVWLVSLLVFGRFGAEQAALAHVFTAAVTAAVSMMAFTKTLRLSFGDLVRSFLPGATLSALCYAGLILTDDVRSGLGPTAGLLAAVAMLVLIWAGALGRSLKRGDVALPKP